MHIGISDVPHQLDPNVQYLRAFCVFIVVLFHCDISFFSWGWIGVDIFFVISGFVVTGSLIAEIDHTSSIDVSKFIGKRCWRLLPQALLTMNFVTFTAYNLFSDASIILPWLNTVKWCTLFSSNIKFYLVNTNYFFVESTPSPFLHFWSLAVEEQFYFVYPLLLRFLYKVFKLSHTRVALMLVLLAMMSFWCFCFNQHSNAMFSFFLLPSRMWQLLLGSIVKILKRTKHDHHAGQSSGKRRNLIMFCVIALVVIFSKHFNSGQNSFSSIWTTLFPTLGASIYLFLSDNESIMHQSIGQYLSFFGDRSYSIYLWHWPFILFMNLFLQSVQNTTVFTDAQYSTVVFCKCCAVFTSLFVALLSYEYVESPLRYRPKSSFSKLHLIPIFILMLLTILFSSVLIIVLENRVSDTTSPRFYPRNLSISIANTTVQQLTQSQTGLGDHKIPGNRWIPGTSAQCQKLHLCSKSGFTFSSSSTQPDRPLYYDSSSACALFRSKGINRITFVGDSFIRHLYQAFINTLTADYGAPSIPDQHKNSCQGNSQFLETQICSLHPISPFQVCNNQVTLRLIYGTQPISDSCLPGEMVLWGIGLHPFPNQFYDHVSYENHIRNAPICRAQENRKCSLHWVTPHFLPNEARTPADFPRGSFVKYHNEMERFFQTYPCGKSLKYDDMYAMTQSLMVPVNGSSSKDANEMANPDGFHYLMTVNLIKTQEILKNL